ncbi:MAG: chromate efflux transporter [Armatimonadota bacterium]|nr:chromate efflux transporter [Armatimonadota bacterium]MDR7450920.1 chromate efflux transporter [Armatimonadota bacterium]MDR7465842.1 chromate efflux transporter [Armatimonadota bacterium]MDR7493750.1 chromate efflux transporter [Armatimonadota bacterium]MDR7498356.1 chromate efflux transporter [Armatimonadota bacterium]
MNSRLGEVAALFLRLGATAFGGPAAHMAMMREEVVRRRQWLSDQEFLDLIGASNLIPGPNSTEMAIHVGYRRAGPAGLIVAGVCFIVPAMLIVLALAWVYVRYGARPEATRLLYGVKPVIIAIVAQALLGLGRTAVKSRFLAALAVTVLALYFLGINEIVLLAGGGMLAVAAARRVRSEAALLLAMAPAYAASAAIAPSAPASLVRMFAIFLKIGAVLYGSGYVLLAFLRSDFVVRLGWLTERQLLDAVAVGQFTPGPVFTTATFIGYLLGGAGGALLATAGIFLPAFVFVAISHPFIARLRRSEAAGAALDGVNAASLALMAGVTFQLGRTALVDVWTVAAALAAWLLLARGRIDSSWLVLGGGILGLLLR